MSKKSNVKDGFIAVQNKEFRHWNHFYKKIFIAHLGVMTIADGGFLMGYNIVTRDQKIVMSKLKLNYYGPDAQINFVNTLVEIKRMLKLETREKNSKDTVIIYVEDLKYTNFLIKYITNTYPKVIEVLDNFEFRSYSDWTKEKEIFKVLEVMQDYADNIFVPEKFFYLTPNQRTRKRIAKACDQDELVDNLYPTTYYEYKNLRKALFGGLVYVHYPNLIINEKIMHLDIKSAYIWALLMQKHCVKRIEAKKPEYYEYYIDNEYEASIGFYEITYKTLNTQIRCYEDSKGNNLKTTRDGKPVTVKIWLNSIDLSILQKMYKVDILSINCISLEAYELGYIPEYLAKILIEEYHKKIIIDKEKFKNLYKLQKVIVNGIYGNTIRRCDSYDEYPDLKKLVRLAPQWGIFTTSYTKQLLINLGKQLGSGWYYSDTDSIFARYTDKNNSIVESYNASIRKNTYKICKELGFNYDVLKDIGTFEMEDICVKFKAEKQKMYMYTTDKFETYVKAAGCEKEQFKKYEDKKDYLTKEELALYELEHIPFGTRTILEEKDKPSDWVAPCGRKFHSDASCYEKTYTGEQLEAKIMELMLLGQLR